VDKNEVFFVAEEVGKHHFPALGVFEGVVFDGFGGAALSGFEEALLGGFDFGLKGVDLFVYLCGWVAHGSFLWVGDVGEGRCEF
jgi:hypothetical protein